MRNPILLTAAMAFIALDPAVARAAPLPTAVLELRVTAPCATEPELRRAVTEKFGYDPFRDEAPVTVSITLGPDGRGVYHGSVSLRDEDGRELGRRTVEDARCESVRESLVLAVSLALDPLGPAGRASASPADRTIDEQPPPASPGAPPRVEAPIAPPMVDRAVPPPPGTRARPSLRVAVGGEVFSGVSPGTVPGVHGSLGLRYGRWGLDVEGGTTSEGSSGNTFGSAQGSVALGSLVPCYGAWSLASFALDGCVVASGGVLFSHGANVSVAASRTDPVASAGVRLQAEWRFARSLGVAAFADGAMELVRSELSVADVGVSQVVWRTSPAAASGGLSLFALIP
jgi:hypothetical protein